jgi:hypothetical protein
MWVRPDEHIQDVGRRNHTFHSRRKSVFRSTRGFTELACLLRQAGWAGKEMTAAELADLLRAQRVGAGRWMAKCPAHADKSPSLSIGTGSDGRVLVKCFAGCSVISILGTVGLRLQDLFAGPPPSPAQLRQAETARQALQLKAKTRGRADAEARSTVRKLEAVTDALGAQLARTADDGPGGNALARLFHLTLERLRQAEAKLEGHR